MLTILLAEKIIDNVSIYSWSISAELLFISNNGINPENEQSLLNVTSYISFKTFLSDVVSILMMSKKKLKSFLS